MIGTTTEITTDIASAPMLWVIPLSLYLLTNIIAFAKRRTINIDLLSTLHVIEGEGGIPVSKIPLIDHKNAPGLIHRKAVKIPQLIILHTGREGSQQ